MQEMADPALSFNRARQTWQHHRSKSWRRHLQAGAQTIGKSDRQVGGLKAKLLGAWCGERFVEAFVKEDVEL